ncbi:MAG: hypothetical protein FWC11_01175 [Firmicutes bacterium]|nr:hypothetical protein [Bacillota bacterium]
MLSVEFLAALLIVLASGIDTFVFGFSYGTARIKVSFKVTFLIAIIASIVMILAFIAGGFLGEVFPHLATLILAVSIIGGMGIFKFVFGIVQILRGKRILVDIIELKENEKESEDLKMQSVNNVKNDLTISPPSVLDPPLSQHSSHSQLKSFFAAKQNPLLLDRDHNKIISFRESFLVALVLTIDSAGAAISLSSLLSWHFYVAIFFLAVAVKIFFMKGGHLLGLRIAKKSRINLSWLSGLILIGLAVGMVFLL